MTQDIRDDQGGAWRPIETAPKDGTRVLTWQPHSASPAIAILHWDPELGSTGVWADEQGGWFVGSPHFWMLLPAPPNSPAIAQDDDAELVERLRIGVTWSDGKRIGAVVGEVNDPVMRRAADRIEALARLSATTPDTTVLVEALTDARRFVDREARQLRNSEEDACKLMDRIDQALASTANPTGESQ